MRAKRIISIDDMRPNVFEALKRAYIKRGVVPRRLHSKNMDPQDQSAEQTQQPAEPVRDTVSRNLVGSNGQPQDGSETTSQKPGLRQSSHDSKSAKGPETLTELTAKSQDILFEVSTVWPFTLFPDTVCLDREKLTIANRYFWRVAKITSTPVSEIMTVEANVGPFFGSVHLTFRFFADNQRTVNFLTRSQAVHLQRLLHGYIIAHRREIDTTHVPKDKLITMLIELGQGAPD